jgi:ribosomal protein S27E
VAQVLEGEGLGWDFLTAKYAKYAKNGKIFNHKEHRDHREKLIFFGPSLCALCALCGKIIAVFAGGQGGRAWLKIKWRWRAGCARKRP